MKNGLTGEVSLPLGFAVKAQDSGEEEAALRLGDGTTEFAGGFDPLPDNGFHVFQSLHAGAAVRGASGQLRNFGGGNGRGLGALTRVTAIAVTTKIALAGLSRAYIALSPKGYQGAVSCSCGR